MRSSPNEIGANPATFATSALLGDNGRTPG